MDELKFGLWNNADSETANRQYSGSGYYASLPNEARFIHSVAKILAHRNAKDKASLCSAHSLYILAPVPEGKGIATKRQATFSQGGVNVAGNIWFGAEAMNSSNGIPIPEGADSDELFKYVSQTLASGDRPAIYFDGSANNAVLRFYPKGVDDPDTCEDISFDGASINDTTLKDILDKIHERSLLTPTASLVSSRLWKDNKKCHPSDEAENVVQSIVEIGLAHALGNVRVRREETSEFGRYDLALIEQDPLNPAQITSHAILELKIVKDFTSSGKKVAEISNRRAVVKGLKQAFAYRNVHGSRISILCCYEMRPKHTLGKKPACNVAKKLEVHFWAWPLFSTTEAARDALVASKLKKTK
ncbi:hypothetical protein SAMN05444156_3106 [Verrucomicrobium sp. GAS474]|uniref:hypothetical protein n=1 Tax=Verrucomicrobium sp. GAS474 TaxID=1882831 RepID=UPI00087BCB05|nr:hypothetical protein [Verrucomicrobium sp. GAS474]SDU29156.1 hypothetical protein SAMN05444156_3106 [Verrucomicrobium sp. GAS474]